MISAMKRAMLILIPVMLLTACQKKNSFRINGNITGDRQDMIYLKRINIDTPLLTDSSKVNKKGRFAFKVRSSEPDFYQLGYSDSEFITLLAGPGEKISIAFEGTSLFEDYSLAGSDGSEQVRMLDQRLNITKKSLDSLRVLYDKASLEDGFEERGPQLEAAFADLIKSLRRKNIEFIVTNLTSMASLKALYQKIDDDTYVLYDTRDLQYMKILADSLGRYYPGSKHVQALTRDLKTGLDQFYRRQLLEIADQFPETKLDPELTDVNGRRIALSSLRGKIVLLTFWSFSSRECITDNLQLKEFYRRYSRNGFEIYQINIDEDEDAWKRAVRFDELPWISVREDDPRDLLNARLFNVRSVPANFLFDRNGEIIGSNLRGRALQIKLDQLFNN